MIRISQKLSPVMIVMAGLILMVGPTVIAQETGVPDTDPAAVDQATPQPEVGSAESAASDGDSERCPQCGRQRGRRGQDVDAAAADDAKGQRSCRCGQGGCRRGRGRGPGTGVGNGPKNGLGKAGPGTGPGQGAGRQGRGKQAEMAAYRTLLENHESITRTFENVSGGIRSVTTSSDPEIAKVLRRHVGQMIDLLENGGWIRIWDPLFAEIFDHADKIETSVEEIEGGLVVIETSQNEQVARLIQAHAAKVTEFAERGQEAYDEPTPLPEGYEAPSN